MTDVTAAKIVLLREARRRSIPPILINPAPSSSGLAGREVSQGEGVKELYEWVTHGGDCGGKNV